MHTILQALTLNADVTIAYHAASGEHTVRTIRPLSIARCANGNTVVRAYDLRRNEPRTFTISRVLDAVLGAIR